MAEHMGRLRRKEAAKRDAFAKGAGGERLMPRQLLAGLGLDEQPPHCQIHLPTGPSALPHLTLDDLKRIPLPPEASLVRVCV